MNPDVLKNYLYQHIPLSHAMGVEVVRAGADGVTLAAPLAPNINHRDTVFGGSASAVAILSAWALLYLGLRARGFDSRIVIQKNTTNYEHPITGRFTATAFAPDPAAWRTFLTTLTRRGRARIGVAAVLDCNGARVGELHGDFVALAVPPADRQVTATLT